MINELIPIIFPPKYGVPECQDLLDFRILVGKNTASQIMGSGGNTVSEIRMKSGATIRRFQVFAPKSNERVLKISGALHKVQKAIALILEIIEITDLSEDTWPHVPHQRHDPVQPVYGGFNRKAAIEDYYHKNSNPPTTEVRLSQPVPKQIVLPPTNMSSIALDSPQFVFPTSHISRPQGPQLDVLQRIQIW